jgi:hypothetical protein
VDPETRQSFERGGTRMLVVNVAPTNGNSGGPLLDERSRVVGVVVVGDPQHKLQDGAIDVAHLQGLVARVEEHLEQFDALGSDVKLAEQSIKQALQGPLALARVLVGPTGDFLDHPDRRPLKDLIHLLLKVYKGLPSDAHADAFQNLFRIFWDSPDAFARSRRASYSELTRDCAREYSALLSDSDVLPEVVGNLVLDCAAERMLPAFAADVLHAMLLGEEVEEVLSTSPIDRAEKLFQVQVRLKPSGKVVPLTLVLRRGGWRVVLAARAKGQGLAGRFGLPDDYLARAYSMVCRPGEESDCKLEGDQQRILKGLERYEGDLRVRPLLHGFRWFERNERRLRRGAPETARTLRGVASVAEGELSVFVPEGRLRVALPARSLR